MVPHYHIFNSNIATNFLSLTKKKIRTGRNFLTKVMVIERKQGPYKTPPPPDPPMVINRHVEGSVTPYTINDQEKVPASTY